MSHTWLGYVVREPNEMTVHFSDSTTRLVDYGIGVDDALLSLSEHLEASPNISSAAFPARREGLVESECHRVHFSVNMTKEEVIAEFDRMGLRPADIFELISCSQALTSYSDEPTYVVALGSYLSDARAGGYPFIQLSSQSLGLHDDHFGDLCSFLACPKAGQSFDPREFESGGGFVGGLSVRRPKEPEQFEDDPYERALAQLPTDVQAKFAAAESAGETVRQMMGMPSDLRTPTADEERRRAAALKAPVPSVTRVPCDECGALILPVTAEATGGYCRRGDCEVARSDKQEAEPGTRKWWKFW